MRGAAWRCAAERGRAGCRAASRCEKIARELLRQRGLWLVALSCEAECGGATRSSAKR